MEEYFFYENVKSVIVKKLKFIEKQEASGLLGSLGTKTPFSEIPLLCPLTF